MVASHLTNKKLSPTTEDSKPVPKFGRLEISLKKTTVLDWLRKQPFYPRFYFARHDGNYEIGGAGSVLHIRHSSTPDIRPLFQEMNSILQSSQPGIRFYGGLRFPAGTSPSVEWEELGSWLFFIPKFEIINSEGVTRLIYNYSLDHPFEEHPQLSEFPLEEERKSFRRPRKKLIARRRDIPNRKQWQEMLKKATKEFKAGKLKKIVLARRSGFELSYPLDPFRFFSDLYHQNPQAFAFLLQPEQDYTFMGISPERLYYRQRGTIWSEAVAGTRPRGKSSKQDEKFTRELLTDQKELKEHRWVVKEIERKLKTLCIQSTKLSQEEIIKFAYVQHLCTRFQGQLKAGLSDADLISQLHPTPAVAGYPRTVALKRIREWEPFDRGWYAGLIGWLEKSAAEFVLALRSAVLKDRSMLVYAGAGIVKESDPAREWKELDNKILNYTRALSEI